VLDKKADDVKIVQCELHDASGELKFIKMSKALIDPQFYEKCKVYYVTPGTQYTVRAGTLTPKDYICYYELINGRWEFTYK
jgi:hypothetical protein